MRKSRSVVGSMLLAVTTLSAMVWPAQGAPPGNYQNPVSDTFSETFADPAVIKAKDGYWYAFATSDPLSAGDDYHLLPTARSEDLVNWEYVGDAFTESNSPKWMAVPEMWAPDIAYFNGRYYLYYVVTDTKHSKNDFDSAIGVATASSPTGPWKDSGRPIVGPREDPDEAGSYMWTFDPDLLTARNGKRYLYYGSYYGGIFVTKLSPNGLRAVGKPTQVAINDRYEGAYVVQHGSFYYLFGSNGDCCAGPTTGYSVFVGRSRRPRGPFEDRFGDAMTKSRAGGSQVIQPNGNRWVGTGHNSIVTDLSGQDWFVYHAIDRDDPYLEEPFEINERPMLLDRLDWIDGWPTVRGGLWASDDAQVGPVTEWDAGSEFNEPGLAGWTNTGGWTEADHSQTGGYVEVDAGGEAEWLLTEEQVGPDVRAEADLRLLGRRGQVGLVVSYVDANNYTALRVGGPPSFPSLGVEVVVDGVLAAVLEPPLPENLAGFDPRDWHNYALELRGTELTMEVTDARQNDPVVQATYELPPEAVRAGSIGVVANNGRTAADNVGAAALYQPHTELAPTPEVGELDPSFGDEFDAGELDPAWSWIREPDGRLKQGSFIWRTQDADLFHDINNASVLLRDAPAGDYTVETKLTLDLGVWSDKSFQQAGLIAYVHDDLFVRLDHVAVFNTRQTEFLKEMPFADDIADGAMAVGAPDGEMWLRLSHRVDESGGEHEFRAASSRDGEEWVWGGVWTLPADTNPRIGLVSMGGSGSRAEFEYFRVYR